MIKLFRNWIKMKNQQVQMKLTFYNYINAVITNQKDVISLVVRLFMKLKDLPVEQLNPVELKQEIVKYIAEIVHAEGEERRDSENPGE